MQKVIWISYILRLEYFSLPAKKIILVTIFRPNHLCLTFTNFLIPTTISFMDMPKQKKVVSKSTTRNRQMAEGTA